MKLARNLILYLFIIFGGQNISGQVIQGANETAERARSQVQEQERIRNDRNGYNSSGFMSDLGPPAPAPLYKGKAKEVGSLSSAFKRTRHMLIVPKIYYGNYKFLLRDKNVSLLRLQPDKNCYSKYIVSVEDFERCSEVVPFPGGGSLYSFRLKSNYPFTLDQEDWWSIHFINNKLVVQNSFVRGIISEIGDIDLKNISSPSKEHEFLDNFKQKNTLAEIKEQSESLKKGVEFNNFIYSNSAPAKLTSTYVLRSIDYQSPRETQLKKIHKRVNKRADITIAFKVVGREDDGSIIILCKELKAGALPN